MTTTTNAFIANVCAASDEMVAYTPPAAPAAPAEGARPPLPRPAVLAWSDISEHFLREDHYTLAQLHAYAEQCALASQTTAPALSEPVGEVSTDGAIDWVLDGPGDWEPGTKVYLRPPAASAGDALDAARWRKCQAMPKAWWLNAIDNAARPRNYGGQTLEEAIDAAPTQCASGADGGGV